MVQRDKAERKRDFATMLYNIERNHSIFPAWHNPPKRKRGDIKGFSDNSRSRLRVLLSTAKWKGCKSCRIGFTFTLPWAATSEEWRRVWHNFVVRITKHRQVSMIWRIELTTGKAKTSGGVRRCHVHAMCWLPVDSVLSKKDSFIMRTECNDRANVIAWMNCNAIGHAWIDSWSCYKDCYPFTEEQIKYATSIGEGKGYGVSLKPLDNSKEGAIHYLCDHTSKHKQEQLGWQGRQWGVVNRCNLTFEHDGEVLSGHEWAIASRQLRRLNRAKRRSRDKWSQPYGDNKCHFGKAEKNLQAVVDAVRCGKIC